jgi:NAD(P)H-flavin reductase
MITSWSEKRLHSLDLFVKSRGGLTGELLRYARLGNGNGSSYLALFSGPHGTSVPVRDYETVLIIADNFGIVSHLPYLKQLIYKYNACKIRTRRIYLI